MPIFRSKRCSSSWCLSMDGFSEASIRRAWERLPSTSLLSTADGRPLIVLSPGIPNSDGGPDYTDGLIRLDGRLYRGTVEVHLHARDWAAHHHDRDAHYNSVILHVVGGCQSTLLPTHTAGKRTVPILILPPDQTPSAAPSPMPPPCVRQPGPVPAASLRRILQRLGWRRIRRRMHTLDTRLNELLREEHWTVHEQQRCYRKAPESNRTTAERWTLCELNAQPAWDQMLYEGIMEGLGYVKNRTPFSELAQNVPLKLLQRWSLTDRETMMAILFGASGLLPSPRGVKEQSSVRYVRRLRHRWKELRRQIHRPLLHEAEWLFFRLRPVNFPTARLAAFVFLLPALFDESGARRILEIFRSAGLPPRARVKRLRTVFAFTPDGFWDRHLHFRNRRTSTPIALGLHRIDAIIMNTLVPMALLYGRLFNDRVLCRHARAVAGALPTPPRNSVTRTVELHVLRGCATIDSAIHHLGAIELHQSYCRRGRCLQCPVRIGNPSRPVPTT